MGMVYPSGVIIHCLPPGASGIVLLLRLTKNDARNGKTLCPDHFSSKRRNEEEERRRKKKKEEERRRNKKPTTESPKYGQSVLTEKRRKKKKEEERRRFPIRNQYRYGTGNIVRCFFLSKTHQTKKFLIRDTIPDAPVAPSCGTPKRPEPLNHRLRMVNILRDMDE